MMMMMARDGVWYVCCGMSDEGIGDVLACEAWGLEVEAWRLIGGKDATSCDMGILGVDGKVMPKDRVDWSLNRKAFSGSGWAGHWAGSCFDGRKGFDFRRESYPDLARKRRGISGLSALAGSSFHPQTT